MNGKRFDFMFILYKKCIVNKKYKKNNFVTKPYGCAFVKPCIKKMKENINMNEMTGKQWQDYVKDYYNENGIDEDNIHEWVDGITPVYYGNIVKQFDEFNYKITEEDVGLEIWKIMTRTIYYKLYDRFIQELHEYSDSIDEEDDEE